MPTPGVVQPNPYTPYPQNQAGYAQGGAAPPSYPYGAYQGQGYPPSTQGFGSYPNQQNTAYAGNQQQYPPSTNPGYPPGYPVYHPADQSEYWWYYITLSRYS